jgi:predicted Zn-dependent protease
MRKTARLGAVALVWALLLPVSAVAEKLKGYIWEIRGSTLIVEGHHVDLTPSTRIERSNHPGISAADLHIGWEVEVEYNSEGEPIVARKLKVKNKRYKEIKLEGFVDGFDEESLQIEGYIVHWNDEIRRADIAPGARIKAEGELLDDGSVVLEKFELRPPGLDGGERAFLEMAAGEMETLRQKLEFYDDPLLEGYVNRVGQSLVPDWVDPREFQFAFFIIDDPDLNAFALPDGTIVIHTGLLAVLENEAQLASVLGHEISHVTHRHAYRGYKSAQKWQWVALGASVAGAAIDGRSGRSPWEGSSLSRILIDLGTGLAVTAAVNGHGRDLEDDADRIGLHYTLDAGYDPFEAPEVWRIFNRQIQDQNAAVNWFFSDHSTHQARISNLTREINLNYREKVDPSNLTRNEKEYGKIVGRIRRQAAVRHYEQKEYEAAENAIRNVLLEYPNDAVAHMYLGKIFWDAGGASAADRALAELRTAVELDPDFPDPHREMGSVYYGHGEYDKAREAFSTYLSMAPIADDADEIRRILQEL